MLLTKEDAVELVQLLKPKPRKLTRRRVLLSLMSVLLGIGLLLVWLYVTAPQPSLAYSVPVPIGDGQRSITIEAFLPKGAGTNGNRYPAIILLHGIEGAQQERRFRFQIADELRDAGYAVFIVHYFGSVDYTDLCCRLPDKTLDHAKIQQKMNEDSPKWIAATTGAIAEISRRDDVDPQRIALDGYSLGGFVALAAAQESITDPAVPDVKCLVVNWGAMFRDTKFTRGYPPTLFVHGEKDDVVPLKYAHQTIAALREVEAETDLYEVLGAGHIAFSAKSAQLTREFLAKHLGVAQP